MIDGKEFSWKIGGEAGFGILTTGAVFARVVARLGYYVFDYLEYPSLIRGGHNAYEAHVGQTVVTSLKKEIDFLMCLNKDTYEFHKARLHEKSYILYDSEDFTPEEGHIQIAIPMKKILRELGGQLVMKNTIALGASLAVLGSDLTIFNTIITKQFQKKGEAVIKFNTDFAKRGFDYVIENYKDKVTTSLRPGVKEDKLILSGNDAFSLGAIIADCRMYVAYPMTPSSSVLATLASWQQKAGIVVRHAEDEISVINTALGSSFTGVRSAVGTSGGGFALMVESVSYAGIAEIPIVIFLSQRPGPATGMPTWTEQGDLLFGIHAGHGEFMKIVLAPGDAKEMVELTAKAFNLADIYQTPVLVMSDMYLSESHQSIVKKDVDAFQASYSIDRGKTISEVKEFPYHRYKIEKDGISPRLLPGQKGIYYQANSYEHLEDSHTTESGKERVLQVNKRSAKVDTYLQEHFVAPMTYGEVEDADVVFVSWGSTKGIILQAQELLLARGIKTSFIHFTHLFPLAVDTVQSFFQNQTKRYILVENNSHGQLAKLLRMETGVDIKEKLLQYDGRPFFPEQIVDYILQSHT